MSGWLGHDWGSLALGACFLTCGAMILLAPRRAPEPEPAWLSEARLLHGDAGTTPPPAKSSFWRDRFTGLLLMLLGALQFLNRGPVPAIVLILMGGMFLAFGLFTMVGWVRSGPPRESWSERRRRRKLERRIARGKDNYFDELRTLLAWDTAPVMAPVWSAAYNFILILFGGAFLALGLATPR
jgi:hypothetical protein